MIVLLLSMLDVVGGVLILLGIKSPIIGIALILKGIMTYLGAISYKIYIDITALIDLAAGLSLLISPSGMWFFGLLSLLKGIIMALMSRKAS